MRITPLTKVNDIAFGSSQEMLISIVGEPNQIRTNSLGLVELCFQSATYRFGSCGLEEATLNAPVIEIENISVAFGILSSFLREHDPNCFEKLGFFVSPAYGVAYDPDCPFWVTAFPQSAVALWQSIGHKNA
jgi:hypothetical protein